MPAPTPQPEPTTPFEGLTFLQIQTLAANWIGVSLTELSAADLAILKAMLNQAVARINTEFPGLVHIRKYYTVTTTASQGTYSAPVGLISIFDPILLDDEPVYSIPTPYENRIASADATPAMQNATRLYAMDWEVDNAAANARPKAILHFFPAPTVTGTAEIWGTGEDNALSADSDLLRIPRAYSSTPIYHAVQPYLATRNRTKDLSTALGLWKDDLDSIARSRLRQRTRGETIQFPNIMRSGRGRRFPGTWRKVP